MSVVLATLCLNEMEWLPKLYEQHKNWPELDKWIFVEAADAVFARVNPTMVSTAGLSVDGTSQFLEQLSQSDPKVVYVPHGFSSHKDLAVCKAEARQRYLTLAEVIRPEFIIAIDADEFYSAADQALIVSWMKQKPQYSCFTFPRREIWHPPSLVAEPLFKYEVIGGFWDIACCHWWRWQSGMNHNSCHVTPNTASGVPFNRRMHRYESVAHAPQMIHLGYAATQLRRKAKNRYYEQRGESQDPKRRWYTRSRAAWETWQPGMELPKGARVRLYTGTVPEVFQ